MIKESKRHKYAAIQDDRVDLIESAVLLVNIFQRAKEGDPDSSVPGGRELEANEAATYDAALSLLERSFKDGPRVLRDTYLEESDETTEDEGEPVRDDDTPMLGELDSRRPPDFKHPMCRCSISVVDDLVERRRMKYQVIRRWSDGISEKVLPFGDLQQAISFIRHSEQPMVDEFEWHIVTCPA